MGNSIYEMIRGAVTAEGYLSENFRLPDDTADGQLKFAPGAMDGIFFYHTAGTESEDSEGYTILVNAIESASEGRTDETFCRVEAFAAKYHVLGFIDLFQEYVIENKDRLTVGNVIDFAVRLMMEGIEVEAVKFGMSLLDLEIYRGLADILDAMLDEGSVTGISALEDPEEVMRAFLTAAKARTDLEAQDYTPLIDLKEYMEQTNQESPSGLYVELTDFLQSGQVQETMRSALERKEAFELARRIDGILVQLFSCFRRFIPI